MAASRSAEWIAVGGGFALLAAVAGAWLAVDTRPPEWDHANHLERTVHCARDLGGGDVRAVLERSSFYPPLVFCAAAVAYRLLPSDVGAAQSVVIVFLGIGMVATYLLGRRIGNGSVGVAAALLFGSAPSIVFSTLRFQLDLPLAAMVAVALVVLLQTDHLERRGAALLAGLVLGLGMLTKPPFAVYILPPLVVLTAAGGRRTRVLVNVGLLLLAAAAVSLAWYGPRLFGLPTQLSSRSFKQAAEAGQPLVLSWPALLYYPRWFITELGLLAALLFPVGLAVAVRRRQWFALAALIPPLALFELIQNKNLRYTLPILPIAAVVAGLGFDLVRGWKRAALGLALAAAGVFQVSATAADRPSGLMVPGLGVPFVLASPPTRADWRHREILGLIARDSRAEPRTVSVVPNYNFFSVSNFRYYALRDGLALQFTRAWSDYPLNIDYVILKTGNQGPEWSAAKPRRIMSEFATDPVLAAAFPPIGEFPLPDGSVATVRVRWLPTVTSLTAAEMGERLREGAGVLLQDFLTDPEDLRVELEYDAAAVRRGIVRRLVVSARSARVGELKRRGAATLRVREARVVFEGLAANPVRAAAEGTLEPLALERVRVERVTVAEADLRAFLAEDRRMARWRVALIDGGADVHIEQAGADIDAHLSIAPGRDGRPVVLDARAVRVGRLPVPDTLTGWIIRHFDPTLRWARLPVAIDVAPVSVRAGAVEIGAP